MTSLMNLILRIWDWTNPGRVAISVEYYACLKDYLVMNTLTTNQQPASSQHSSTRWTKQPYQAYSTWWRRL